MNAMIPLLYAVKESCAIGMDMNPAVQCTEQQALPPVDKLISEQVLAQASLQIQRDLAFALSSTTNLEDVLRCVLDAILLIEGVDCGGVYLIDRHTGAMNLIISSGLSPYFVTRVAHFDAQAPQTLLVMKGQPIYRQYQDVAPPNDIIRTNEKLRALAIIPIKSEGKVIAALNIGSHSYDTIQSQVRDMLDVVAAQMGSVIARVRTETALRESQSNLQSLFDTLDDLLFIFRQDGRILHFNPMVEACLGYGSDELRRMNMMDIHPPEHRAKIQILFSRMNGQQTSVLTIPMLKKDGTHVAMETRINRGKWNDQEVLFGNARNITVIKQTEEMLLHTNEQLKLSVSRLEQRNLEITLMNEMGEQLQSCLSVDDAYIVIASYMVQLFENQSGAIYILNHRHNLVESVAHWGDIPLQSMVFAPDECWSLRRGRMHIVEHANMALQCSHIKTSDMQASLCVPLIAQGDTMGLLHICCQTPILKQTMDRWSQLATVVAEHIALALANLNLREKLHYQSTHDVLTGLFNRRYLEETLERELLKAHRYNRPVGVVMLDIDHFKRFNDIYGHKAGDAMLQAVGTFLQSNIRGEDIACRYGGEEFTLILPEASLEDSVQRAKELCARIKNLQVEFGGKILGLVTFSLGVASFPNHGTSGESLIRAADSALYCAKADGRDRVVVAKATEWVAA